MSQKNQNLKVAFVNIQLKNVLKVKPAQWEELWIVRRTTGHFPSARTLVCELHRKTVCVINHAVII